MGRGRKGRSRKNCNLAQPGELYHCRRLQVYGLDSERLYASYFGGDEELLGYRSSENRSWTSRSGTSHKRVWAQRLPQCAVPMLLRLGLPEDLEAKELWLRHLPESRVLPYGKKDLFLAKVGYQENTRNSHRSHCQGMERCKKGERTKYRKMTIDSTGSTRTTSGRWVQQAGTRRCFSIVQPGVICSSFRRDGNDSINFFERSFLQAEDK